MRNIRWFRTKEEAKAFAKTKRNASVTKSSRKQIEDYGEEYTYSVVWTI